MKATTTRLEQLLNRGVEYLSQVPETALTKKPSPEKWSKKEILGHLIDSAVNNLQRFTEIQFENKPYKVRKYNQEALVKANDYQHSDMSEMVKFWLSINQRINYLIGKQTEDTLRFKIEVEPEVYADLGFLMKDYVDHLEHHLHQITKSS